MNPGAVIRKHLSDPKSVFVFPSEIAARFWLKQAFRYTDRRTLSRSCFLSWDQFKKTVLRYPRELRPVNQAGRLLFVHRLLEENKQALLFKRIINPRYAANPAALYGNFLRILPTLHRLEALGPDSGQVPGEKRQDLHHLRQRYSDFLARYGLFEPNYLEPLLEAGDRRYFLFHPQVIEDYAAFQGLIGNCRQITLLPGETLSGPEAGAGKPEGSPQGAAPGAGAGMPEAAGLPAAGLPGEVDTRAADTGQADTRQEQPPQPTILAFENSLQELEWAMARIGALLDQGIDPEQIILTVAELEQLGSYLERAAAICQIPLNIHRGRPLSDYPETRLFSQIGECVERNFSLESLKALLLNRAVPWKDRRSPGDLIRLGVEYKILLGIPGDQLSAKDRRAPEDQQGPENQGGPDRWQQALDKAQGCGQHGEFSYPDLRKFYRGLKARLLRIYRAEDFAALKGSLVRFMAGFLDASAWSQESLKVHQFALNTLDELRDALTRSSSHIHHPYSLWLRYLGERIYVRRDDPSGVPVYPYRASAGVYPDYHFIINASQGGTARTLRRFPFLSLHEEGDIAGAEENLAERYLNLYVRSGAGVFFSYSRRSFYNTHLPPAFFIGRGIIQPSSFLQEAPQRSTAGPDPAAPLAAERSFWAGGDFPARLYYSQQEGFSAAVKTILAGKGSDFSRQPIGKGELGQRIARELPGRDSALQITATSLEAYLNCPFHFLFQRVVGLAEEPFQPQMVDPLEFGGLMHRVFQDFYHRIGQAEGRLLPARRERYRELIRSCAARVMDHYARCHPIPMEPIFRELRRRVEILALAHLERELEELPGELMVSVEASLTLDWEEEGVYLSGKLDRISRDPSQGGYTLIDYKKRKLPAGQEIFGPEPVSFQMPFYLYLMKKQGLETEKAAYYSVEEQKYRYVLHPHKRAMTDRQGLERSFTLLLERIREMAAGIRGGRYQVPSGEERNRCRYCPFRGLCREKYALGSIGG